MFTRLDEVDVKGKRVLLREDLNVPLQGDKILDATRIEAALPTIKYLRDQGATIILMSHLGRPTEGQFSPEYSLKSIQKYLEARLGEAIPLFGLEDINLSLKSKISLLENVRFYPGEESNDDKLGRRFAQLADIFVMDAFAVAHRAQASTVAVTKFIAKSVAGPLLLRELEAIDAVVDSPKQPVVAIVGGSKVSTKLDALYYLLDKVDTLILGGGIANTFLLAQGIGVGQSLVEEALVPSAKDILQKAKKTNKVIWSPRDVVVGDEMSNSARTSIKSLKEINSEDKIFDIGPKSIAELKSMITTAATILWNGPIGVFEYEPYQAGTKALAKAIASSRAFSVAGGGDTISAINQFEVTEDISYISTGGGAFLTLLEGKTLPAVEALSL